MQQLIPQNPNFKEMIKEKMQHNAFMHFIGFEPTIIEAGYVEGELKIEKHHLQQTGFLHGGVTCTLADLVSGWAAFTLVKNGETVVTVEIKTNYLNPGIGQLAIAKGKVIKAGKMLTFTECEIFCINHGQQLLIAKSYATFATIEV
ncbi:MAG: PaaI family thioesterase [Bacteroidia bacterium]